MPEAPDQNIRAVLQMAAANPAFHMLLINNRETALKDFPLSDAERNMLLSATATQIEKMVECVVEAPPMPEAPDQNIRAVLQMAAANPAFHVLLLNNREAALKGFPLSDAERNMLLSATATQIEKMVECVVEAPPMPEAPDQNIRAVLQMAAANPAFHVLLLNNREAALKGFPLSDAERNMLLSATATQIEKMVECVVEAPPMPEAPDQNIRAVLQMAAANPAFHVLLLNNREAALKGFPLSDAERNMLLSATATQIEKMIVQARQQKWYETPVSRRTVAIAAVTGALTVGGLALVTNSTTGIRPERLAPAYLDEIVKAESIYREQYGRYGNLEELTGGESPALDPGLVRWSGRISFEVTVSGGSFTATARMKNTNRAWQVGPDGQVKPLE